MAPIKKQKDKVTDEWSEKVKLNMRRMRERIRNNPEMYEKYKRKKRERYHKRKQEGKIKLIEDSTEREKISKRKLWRESSKKHREGRRIIQNVIKADTPPPSPVPPGEGEGNNQVHYNPGTSRQFQQGKKQSRKHKRELLKKIEKLQKNNEALKKKVEKYKKRAHRVNKKHKVTDPDSPGAKVYELLKNPNVKQEEIKKKLLLGEVITKQVQENLQGEQSLEGKRKVLKAVSERLMKKYRFLNVLSTMSPKLCKSKILLKKRTLIKSTLRKTIQAFLERDENSRMMPGKKDTITRFNCKKQKRYLNDSLQIIHDKFIKAYPHYEKLSYPEFCKNRPFWVLIPNARIRETCLCMQHENMSLIVSKLRLLHIINESSPDQLCKKLCCCDGLLGEKCLDRTCEGCKDRQINVNDFNEEEDITYKIWKTQKVKIVVKGKEKECQKTIKEEIRSTKGLLMEELKENLPKYMLHLRNIIHQYRAIDDVKKNLSVNEILIHLDFSENYNCKYGQEVQSAHFGGSKPQISLYTVIVYKGTIEGDLPDHNNYCTISKNLRHDPSTICAHLEPIFKKIKSQVTEIKVAHFLSDGPTTQYKNKKMFNFIATYIAQTLDVDQIEWHYSESGQGKGAPDGIGGCVKRTADKCVAHGKDVSTFDELLLILKKHCKNINIISIDEESILEFDTKIPENLHAFKGTMQIRQVCWYKDVPYTLYFRNLSCLSCVGACEHYNLGSLELQNNEDTEFEKTASSKLRYSDVYSSSSSDDENKENEIITGQKYEIADGKFVVVQFSGRKRKRHYIGKILSEAKNDEVISFLRRKNKIKFVFPAEKDVHPVAKDDVVLVLKHPEERRNQYFFNFEEIEAIENLD